MQVSVTEGCIDRVRFVRFYPLEDALIQVTLALFELNKDPPDNQAAAGILVSAVADLDAALDIDPGNPDVLTAIDDLIDAAQQLAVDAINLAIDRGGNGVKIAEANQALTDGNSEADPIAAADHYKDAVAKAEGA